MAEIRDAFEAYSTGELAEFELRSALRAEVQTQPGSVPRYAAMAAALRRRRLISAELEAAVLSDMQAVVANTVPPADAGFHEVATRANDLRAAQSAAAKPPTTRAPSENVPPASGTSASLAREPASGPRGVTGPRTGTRNVTGARNLTSPPSVTGPASVSGPRTAAGPHEHVASQANASIGPIFAVPPRDARPATTDNRAAPLADRTTGGSRSVSWDAREKLAEPEATIGVGTTLRERFELVDVLGRGGMGVVYKAVDQREVENKGREVHVAIKVLNEEFKRHPESARALQRESKKSMRLAHPNIVLVRDFDRDHGNVFMVMELLYGTPLDQLIARQFPKGMPVERVIEIVTGLGAALSYAHQQGIVHADFKPSNAFLTEQNTVKVLDFGVARVALALDRNESTIFDAGKLNAVSPAYASVELLIGEAPDPRDDIYALACVTYFLLTARHPFNGVDAVKARDSELQPRPIPGLGERQWRALRSALVFDRWDRTPSVREFLTQFTAMRSGGMSSFMSSLSRTAGQAVRTVRNGYDRVLDVAVQRPWLPIIPAAVLLVLGAVFVVAHRPPSPSAPPSASAVPVTAAAAVVAASGKPDDHPVPEDAGSVQALRQRVAKIDPAAPDFIDTAVASASDVRALAALSADDPVVQRLRTALQNALAAQVETLLTRDDLNGAHRLVNKVGAVLPATTLRAYSSDALVRRGQVIHLMNQPEPTQHWADQLASAISDLAALSPPDDPLIRKARERSDAAFLAEAQQARDQQRSDDARESLATGMTVNPQSSTLSRAAVALADNQPMPSTSTSGRHDATSAPLVANSSKPSTAPAPIAPAPAAGTGTASTPPATTPPATTPPATDAVASAPRAVQAIIAQAKQQMADADTESALATLAAGRRRFGGSQPLKDLEITYDRVEEEYERIDLAPALNVQQHQEWLAEIRSLAGEQDYRQIEQMLARTLSRDIAAQRQRADRPTVVAALLSAGRKLFPGYAALLEDSQVATTAENVGVSGSSGASAAGEAAVK
ncbi:MAG TPA: protein kinase [Steroidobacteraceae bacterium]|nr:protein kinase [Steroidobacteraceae bacterium]